MRFLRFYGQYDQVYLCPCQGDTSFWSPSKVSFATGSAAGEQIPILDWEREKILTGKEKDYLSLLRF